MDLHKQQISIITTSFTSSLVDTIPLIDDQHLHWVWELPAKVIKIIIVIARLYDALQTSGVLFNRLCPGRSGPNGTKAKPTKKLLV